MFFKKVLGAAAAAVLSAAMLAFPAGAAETDDTYIDLIENVWINYYSVPLFSPRAVRARASHSSAPEIYSYSATEHTVTLSWKGIGSADGYDVYLIDNGTAVPVVSTNGETTAAVDNLASGREYIFRVQAFRYSEGGKLKSSKGQPFSTVTAPARRGVEITGVSRDRENNTVTVLWDGNASGNIIYAYNYNEEKWDRAAVVSENTNSYTFSLDTPAKGSKVALGDMQGNEYGYRFALKSYSRDENELHTYWSKLGRMQDAYYDKEDLKAFFGSELQLMENVLAANYTGNSRRLYTFYSTSADEEGIISSSSRQVFISDASIEAIEKFSEEHFGDDWTDAEKLMYTVNWINKNVTYDINYEAPGKGYADNIFTYRLGQCDSYNGTLAEMLAYWGYDGVFLQCMTNSVRFSQHLRAGIISGDKYYTFESGNDKRSKGWIWLIKEGMEVPFEGTLDISAEEEEERSVKYMEDLARAFFETRGDQSEPAAADTGDISCGGSEEDLYDISDDDASLFLFAAEHFSAVQDAVSEQLPGEEQESSDEDTAEAPDEEEAPSEEDEEEEDGAGSSSDENTEETEENSGEEDTGEEASAEEDLSEENSGDPDGEGLEEGSDADTEQTEEAAASGEDTEATDTEKTE